MPEGDEQEYFRAQREGTKKQELLGFEPRLQGSSNTIIKTLRPKPLDDSSDACHTAEASIH